MKKQMISFSNPQHKRLTNRANDLGISVAELTRRIVDSHLTRARVIETNLSSPSLFEPREGRILGVAMVVPGGVLEGTISERDIAMELGPELAFEKNGVKRRKPKSRPRGLVDIED